MSNSSRQVHQRTKEQVLTIDWALLLRRLRVRGGQLFTAARHRAANTEYIPPAWMSRFRLTWFRIGLIGVLVFVFTQRQLEFTISMGKEGVHAGAQGGTNATADPAAAAASLTSNPAPQPQTSRFSFFGSGNDTPAPAAERNWSVDNYDVATVRAYVNRFTRVARTEEDKYSIPVAAKLAMAILESNAGTNHEADRDNNHFGRPAAAGYYENAWTNWRLHSEMIQRDYPQLANESVNHQQWIAALVKTGYSSDPAYGQKLLEIIQRFGLDKL